ncbi:hypothetical protein Pfo_013236 [Paulownia fortunei]|nr:hypothetical protein Pfo_013236 [Paulownia fortunei]
MNWKVYMVRVFAFVAILLFVVGICGALEPVDEADIQEPVFSKGDHAAAAAKTLVISTENNKNDEGVDDSGSCSKDNIVVDQGPTAPLPSGIPTYTVEIMNVCTTGSCSISSIHLSCGWFSSAREIDPNIFERIAYDDCLVKGGKPLNPGEAISFQYANTFEYPLSVSSVACN